jgi:hypothetical protein
MSCEQNTLLAAVVKAIAAVVVTEALATHKVVLSVTVTVYVQLTIQL